MINFFKNYILPTIIGASAVLLIIIAFIAVIVLVLLFQINIYHVGYFIIAIVVTWCFYDLGKDLIKYFTGKK